MGKKTIIFDFNRTLYDPETDGLFDGVIDMLDELRQEERRLVLLSKQEGGRETLLSDLGIDGYFEGAHFVPRKTREVMLDIVETDGLDPKETLVVGDVPHSEIKAGNAVGMETVWLRHGYFADTVPDDESTPKHIVLSIPELRDLLKRLA